MERKHTLGANALIFNVLAIVAWLDLAAALRTNAVRQQHGVESNRSQAGYLPVVPAAGGYSIRRLPAYTTSASTGTLRMSAKSLASTHQPVPQMESMQQSVTLSGNSNGKAFILPGPGPDMNTIVTYPEISMVPSSGVSAAGYNPSSSINVPISSSMSAFSPMTMTVPASNAMNTNVAVSAPTVPTIDGNMYPSMYPSGLTIPASAGTMTTGLAMPSPYAYDPMMGAGLTMPASIGTMPTALTMPAPMGTMTTGGFAMPSSVGTMTAAGYEVPTSVGMTGFPSAATGFTMPASTGSMGLRRTVQTVPMMRVASASPRMVAANSPYIMRANSVPGRNARELSNMAAQARAGMLAGEEYYRDGP